MHQESLVGVVLSSAPFPVREVGACPARHLTESGHVLDEARQDGVGDLSSSSFDG